MTRPNIVRADTLDLQDQENPTAAEHQKPNIQGGLAPHQRAELHHVLEERDSEDHALADAWNITDNLTDEPDAIDQAQHQQQQNGGHQGQANGVQHAGEEGGEDPDADDDMMDRISSSPSIDDGGYSPHSSPPSTLPRMRPGWPMRSSSLTPSPRNTPTPTQETFNQSSSSPTDSSPFLQTPRHLPLQARRANSGASRLASHIEASSTPFEQTPQHLPVVMVEQIEDRFSLTSKHHHSRGRYTDSRELEPLLEIEDDDMNLLEPVKKDDDDVELGEIRCTGMPEQTMGRPEPHEYRRGSDQTSQSSVIVYDRPTDSPFRIYNFSRNATYPPEPYLEQSPSLNSIASVDLKDVLLPVDDPLLDTPPSPTDDADLWESLSSDSGSLDESTNDDDTDALFADLEPRFIDSGWGGECLRETEDIDFEFVYALHTFVATVEGQANATKGDTMVLLDDSNSYWWLVRVVKDASIGYLPAEHIETPTERLARLNKHRNIDLSATMLSDNSERSRNPLKKAMRRRNAKTVQFAAPTYVEASDYDYDTEDEEEPAAEQQTTAAQVEEVQQNGEQHEDEQVAERKITPDEIVVRTSSSSSRLSFDREQAATLAAANNIDEPQLSPKLFDKTEAGPLKSKRTRNTDSFLKDDSIETRKITLTPGLLREESAGKSSTSTDSARNASLENIVSSIQQPAPLSKKDSKKEKKEKKPGMLSGLFKSKKKDKKAVDSGSLSDAEKPSNEYQRESPSRSPLTSGRASPVQDVTSLISPIDTRRPEVQTRQPTRGKLQKPPPSDASPVRETPAQEPSSEFVAELQGSEAAVEMGAADASPPAAQEPEPVQRDLAVEDKPTNDGPLSPITNLLKRDDSKTQKPAKAKKAKERMELDDFDSPSEEDGPNTFKEQEERAATAEGDEDGERLSESPIEITHNTFMHGTESIHIPTPSPDDQPGLEDEEEEEEEEPESLTSSPSIIDHPAEPIEPGDKLGDDDLTPTAPRSPNAATALAANSKAIETPTRELSVDSVDSSNNLTPATSASQQSWSDSSLRAWLEDGSEVKDMMVMIHDTSGVVPVAEDHPLMLGLFTEQRKGVQDMMTQLDGLLGSYLQRKGIALNS